MRINHNMAALNTYNRLSSNNVETGKSLEKLSSGQRINRAADDAAGLAISEKMRSQIRGLDQGTRNAQDGISLIQTAEGAMNETHSILQRMRELAVQGANDTYATTDRTNIKSELDELNKELDHIGDTQFNGQKIFGAAAKFNLQIGPSDTTTLASDGLALDTTNMKIDSTSLAVNAVAVDTNANANTAIKALDAAIDTVSGYRATLGANQNRLEHTINNLSTTSENMTAAESRIRDTDMAKEMMNFTKNNILSQAATAMLSQANQQPQGVLQLLR